MCIKGQLNVLITNGLENNWPSLTYRYKKYICPVFSPHLTPQKILAQPLGLGSCTKISFTYCLQVRLMTIFHWTCCSQKSHESEKGRWVEKAMLTRQFVISCIWCGAIYRKIDDELTLLWKYPGVTMQNECACKTNLITPYFLHWIINQLWQMLIFSKILLCEITLRIFRVFWVYGISILRVHFKSHIDLLEGIAVINILFLKGD